MKEFFSQPTRNQLEKCDIGPENLIYDIDPLLKMRERKANVSYSRDGVLFPRQANIYEDQDKNNWYEIKKEPRKQMLVSLLSQPLFNISTVIEVPRNQVRGISKLLSRLHPQISSIYNAGIDIVGGASSLFLSKELHLNKVEQKESDESVADFLVFESIFDSANDSDRELLRGHNFRLNKDSYTMFDFDKSGIIPLKHFEEWKLYQEEIGGTAYIPMAKEIYAEYIPKIKYDKFNIEKLKELNLVYKLIFDKLTKVLDFFDGLEGENFVSAVLRKTKYADEFRAKHKKDKIDESYIDPHELTQGLLAQVKYNLSGLLNELKTNKDWYLWQINREDAHEMMSNDHESRFIYWKSSTYGDNKNPCKDWSTMRSLSDEEFAEEKDKAKKQYDELITEIEKKLIKITGEN